MPAKNFKIDDKVLARVKGYPAWPAKIIAVNRKKYSVLFYGTNETASVSGDSIMYYLKNKDQNDKFMKRKFYKEAVYEIEDDIEAAGGSDGCLVDDTAEDKPMRKETKASKKRKRSSVDHGNASKVTKTESDVSSKSSSNFESSQETLKDDQGSEDMEIEHPSVINSIVSENRSIIEAETRLFPEDEKEKANSSNNESIPSEMNNSKGTTNVKDEENASNDQKSDNQEQKQIDLKDIYLIDEFYLTAIKHYAERVRKTAKSKELPPDNTSIDDPEDTRLKVLPLKFKQTYCGIKFITKDLKSFKSEYERALDDEIAADEVLKLKETVLSSDSLPIDERIIADLGCDEKYVAKMHDLALVAYKKDKKEWLQRQADLYRNIVGMKKCLALDTPKPKDSLVYLDSILNMYIEPVMLKKHAHIVESVKHVSEYIGNKVHAEMSDEEAAERVEECLEIQKKANLIMDKFKSLFPYGKEDDFLETFKKESDTFIALTKDYDFEVFAEPLSRKGQLDIIYETFGKPEKALKQQQVVD